MKNIMMFSCEGVSILSRIALVISKKKEIKSNALNGLILLNVIGSPPLHYYIDKNTNFILRIIFTSK